jgi:hypothetical protein
MPAENPTPKRGRIYQRLAELEADQGALGLEVRTLIARGEASAGMFSKLKPTGQHRLNTLLYQCQRDRTGPSFTTRAHPNAPSGAKYYKPRTVLLWALMRWGDLEFAGKMPRSEYWARDESTSEREARAVSDREQMAEEVERLRATLAQQVRDAARLQAMLRRRTLLSREALLSQATTINGRGIYFLWNNFELVYIGQTRTFYGRMASHVSGEKIFDRYTFLPVASEEELNDLEALYIEALNPPLNRARPKPSDAGAIADEAQQIQ